MRIKKMESMDGLSMLKSQYVEYSTAPLDGMWLCGFVPMACHFGIYEGDELFGYFCVNDDGYLLQFWMASGHQGESSKIFDAIVAGGDSQLPRIKGAFVSTAEPLYLSLCLDRFPNFEVNTLMYQYERDISQPSETDSVSLVQIESEQLLQAVAFAVASIGAPEEWLTDYYDNLISRQELFGVWKHKMLVATGETRRRDEYDTEYADVGMIVSKPERGHGLGAKILRQLVAMNCKNGLRSICSTEKSNHFAQRAIRLAGFHASNRIIQFHHQ